MYQRYKYIQLAAFSLALMIMTSFLAAVVDDGVLQIIIIASFLVSLVVAVFGIEGYSDSLAMDIEGKQTGLQLDIVARVYGVKRRFAGWEFDSKLHARVTAAIDNLASSNRDWMKRL